MERRRQARLARHSCGALVVDGVYLRCRRSLHDGPRQGVLLVAVGVRPEGRLQVLDWLAAASGGKLRSGYSCTASHGAWRMSL